MVNIKELKDKITGKLKTEGKGKASIEMIWGEGNES